MAGARSRDMEDKLRSIGLHPIDVDVIGSQLVISFLDGSEARRCADLLRASSAGNATVEQWTNEGQQEWMVRCNFEVSMAIGDLPAHPRDRQGNYLNVGDRVRTSSGSEDEVVQVQADPDRVRLRGGQTVAASDVVKMEVVSMAGWGDKGRCPSCNALIQLPAGPDSPFPAHERGDRPGVQCGASGQSAREVSRATGGGFSAFDYRTQDMRGNELSVGDRVDAGAGSQGVITKIDPNGANGHTILVRKDSGWDNWHRAENLRKMELDAVDFARSTRCPFCTRSVTLHARTLGEHRAVDGLCDGSGRRVAEFDYAGRAVLEAKMATFAQDKNGADLSVGDYVYIAPFNYRITQLNGSQFVARSENGQEASGNTSKVEKVRTDGQIVGLR